MPSSDQIASLTPSTHVESGAIAKPSMFTFGRPAGRAYTTSGTIVPVASTFSSVDDTEHVLSHSAQIRWRSASNWTSITWPMPVSTTATRWNVPSAFRA